MAHADIERLRSIKTFPSLVKYLRDELDWPIDSDDVEDLTFEYEADELGIDPKTAAKIQEIKQLRPMDTKQPWGIFFVKFEPKRLPVVVLRKILNQLVIKKRASAGKSTQAAWNLHDLLFISAYGEQDERQITFAHFTQDPAGKELPTLRVLGWDGRDTALHVDQVVQTLKSNFRWPRTFNADQVRERWSSAFAYRHREAITTASELAERLAVLASRIRDHVLEVMSYETEKGAIRQLYSAFRAALVHDLEPKDFADMYAQTIAYGLLSARIADPTKTTLDDFAAHMRTNPFLRELMETFLRIGGRKGKAGGPGIDFDELGVSEVVALLDEANMEAVVRDFGDRNRSEDPVIHFYEHFLEAYDRRLKVSRGVFYTPQPVVSYMVRSVHELLQTEFGLEDGLADTTTWGEMLKNHPGLKLPPLTDESGEKRTISPNEPFVQILDPATGTATFLVEVIDVIYRTVTAKWQKQRLTEIQQVAAWNDYVPKHLLPRLHAYELMMAPYAIAHMKIGLKLTETGYRFETEERARIFLTNALEPWVEQPMLIGFEALAHEASAVDEIKRHKRFTVVIGNPPYSKMSGNLGLHAVGLIESFRYVNGERIIEKGALALELNLQDDYVKFWALLRRVLLTTNIGVGAYITNSRYLASTTLRGLRWNLKELFDSGQFLNLGGQVSERAAVSGPDENVFDIEQGVAVGVGIRKGNHSGMAFVGYQNCRGTREEKYAWLNAESSSSLNTKVILEPPFFRFSRGVDEAESQFSAWYDLNEIFPFNSGCIITSRDNLAIDIDRQVLLDKIARFSKSPRGDLTIEEEIGYSSKSKWDVEACKASIRSDPDQAKKVRRVSYRPFDERWIYYSTRLLDTPSRPVCDSVYDHENLVLLTPKVKTSESFNHVLVSRMPAEKKSCSHDRATQMFPLFRYESGLIQDKQSNLGAKFESAARAVAGSNATPEACFAYIYAVLYSPEYRRRFGNALRDSFPRIPVTTQSKLFHTLARLGSELTDLHLLESPKLAKHITKCIGSHHPTVDKISWSGNTVWIDKSRTIGFQGVREEVWNFHIGGYKVCEKWLKDRKGCALSQDDLTHYQKIIVVLSETIRLMGEIDEVIEEHGGWPSAFGTGE